MSALAAVLRPSRSRNCGSCSLEQTTGCFTTDTLDEEGNDQQVVCVAIHSCHGVRSPAAGPSSSYGWSWDIENALVLSTGRLSEPAFLLPYLHAPLSWGHDLEGRDGRFRAVVLRVLETGPWWLAVLYAGPLAVVIHEKVRFQIE